MEFINLVCFLVDELVCLRFVRKGRFLHSRVLFLVFSSLMKCLLSFLMIYADPNILWYHLGAITLQAYKLAVWIHLLYSRHDVTCTLHCS